MIDKTFQPKFLESREYILQLFVREGRASQIYCVNEDKKRDLTPEDVKHIQAIIKKGNPRPGEKREFVWDEKSSLWKEI